MFQLTKTRAAEYANLSSVHRTGFTSPADPINCVVETAVNLAGEGVNLVDAAGAVGIDQIGQAVDDAGQAAADAGAVGIGQIDQAVDDAGQAAADAGAVGIGQIGQALDDAGQAVTANDVVTIADDALAGAIGGELG